ncbi:hypothetical protein [Conexibacter arvalis]|uniref:Uncharacterized protein n=1 Tax=Conexibacter arvalis TaxID=912552 RepID=A0A840I9G9_9ACTN|nr:hypothetical protein [Conexibacter arvalis]MBB4660891.1 hypothetical protein [Conexibacter arvalis]
MRPAFLGELLADPAEWSPALLRLIGDPGTSPAVRRAAVTGLGRSGLSALVLQPALLSDEEALALHAWKIVAGLADAAELGVLAALPPHRSSSVAAQARFGVATVAHRHGLPGYELMPPQHLLAAADGCATAPIALAPASAADAVALARLDRADLHGLRPSTRATWRLDCAGRSLLLALDPALSGDPRRHLSVPRLLGVVATTDAVNRHAAVELLVLADPTGPANFDVAVCRRDGRVVCAGHGTVCGERAGAPAPHVTLRRVARAGATPLELPLTLDDGRLAATAAAWAGRRPARRSLLL